MTFATAAVTMSEVAAAEAAATTAAGVAAATTAAETAAASQAGTAATAAAANAAPAITGGIEGIGTTTTAAAPVAGQGITQALPGVVPETSTAAAPAGLPPPPPPPPGVIPPPEVSQGFGQGATNLNVGMPGGIQGPGVNLTPSPTSLPNLPYNETSLIPQGLPADALKMQSGAEGLGGINGASVTPTPSALQRGFNTVMDYAKANPYPIAYAGATMLNAAMQPDQEQPKKKPNSLSNYKLASNFQGNFPTPNVYKPQYNNYQTAAKGGVMHSYAEGGIASMAGGGAMAGQAYPQGLLNSNTNDMPSQSPMNNNVVDGGYEPAINTYTGSRVGPGMAEGGIARFYGGGDTGYTGMGGQQNANGGMTGMMGKGGFGFPTTAVDPLANFKRADNVTPNVYTPSYNSEAGSKVGPPSNANYLNTVSNWGGAQNLLNTYAPNLNTATAPETSAAPAAAAAAPAVQGLAEGGLPLMRMGQGIVSEDDPDFAFTSPYKTAAGRLDKLYKKTHVPKTAMAIAPELGAVDLTPAMTRTAAQGGIMGAEPSLGGYAAGGNPRLLQGPGDGMSDDIPAVIANKQPARLADGEFVIPADVVSHLGNGSTDAGAKQLHGMMDNIRKARTGRKAQGKQINPNKFMPK
jgi:hypothetical protein